MSDSASAKLWDSISPELRHSLANAGFHLPGSEEWTQISTDLVSPIPPGHVLHIMRLPAATAYPESLAEFALEVALTIPAANLFKYLTHERVKKISSTQWDERIRRTRVFRFDHNVTAEDLHTLRGIVDARTPLPFIDAFWHEGRIIDITISGLFEVPRAERTQRAALLSVGLELFNIERDETRIKNLLAAIMTANIKKQWGGARRKPKDFTPEMCKRFAKKTNDLQPLWELIIEFFQKAEYDTGCVRAVKELGWFKQHSATCIRPVPEYLLKRVFERERKGGQEYWPRTFALLHAKLELGITNENALSTLHTLYYRGNTLLNESGEPNAI